MTAYIGNYKEHFDFETLVNTVKSCEGDRRVFDGSYFDMTKPGFGEIMNNWSEAKYDLASIEWYNFYSGVHFSKDVGEKFESLFNATAIKVWISNIRPGKCFPYHWDADTNTEKYIEGKMVRYQMFIEDYKLGHFFVMSDTTLTGYKQGDVYKWDDYKEWHAGGNIGFTPKFIFNFLGIKND
jgi:hypothetical protein